MKKHISIDIESLATTPDMKIVSIGAVVFTASAQIEDKFYAVLDLREQALRGQSETALKWWEEQPDEVREALTTTAREPVLFALGRLDEYVKRHEANLAGIWAKGPSFDLAALEHMYASYKLPPPWGYKLARCYRTVAAQMKNTFPAAELPDYGPLVAHNALDDAKWQARSLAYMNQQLGGHIL